MSCWGYSMLWLVVCVFGCVFGLVCCMDLLYYCVLLFCVFVGDV